MKIKQYNNKKEIKINKFEKDFAKKIDIIETMLDKYYIIFEDEEDFIVWTWAKVEDVKFADVMFISIIHLLNEKNKNNIMKK